VLVRSALGAQLRRRRVEQRRTLREVSSRARVSLGYLSEVERGQKEASSELLASICDALDMRLSTLLQDTSDDLALAELVDGVEMSLQSSVRALPPRVGAAGLVPARGDAAPTLATTVVVPNGGEARGADVAVDCAA
jgi:transcriptional regulator with XRE-family HTH domain